MNLYYDEEADFLEIQVGGSTAGYFRDVGEGVAERIDEKTGKITGIAVLSFKKRMKNKQDLKVELPVKLEIS